MGEPNHVVRIAFYDADSHDPLGVVRHPLVPRVGEHVSLPIASYEVVGVWWSHPSEGSQSYEDGERGGMVTAMVRQSRQPFAPVLEGTDKT